MPKPQTAPYGSWRSPILSDLIVAGTIGLEQIALDGEDIYWVELRPTEGGRNVIVRRTPDGRLSDMTPAPFNARTRVHEYGGGAFAVLDGTVYFSNLGDQRLYRQRPGGIPEPLTPPVDRRYADAVADPRRGRLICVREDHTIPTSQPINTLVSVPLTPGREDRVLVAGNDFYASPRLSPDGSHLAWLTWNHPRMPWDGTELWVALVRADGTLGPAELVAGGVEESVQQPQWSPGGILHFISDRSGWWNLYRWRGGPSEPLCPRAAEFGEPPWTLGLSTYAFLSAERILCAYIERGASRLAILDATTDRLEPLEAAYTEICSVRATARQAAFRAGSATAHNAIIRLDPATRQTQVLRRSSDLAIDPGYLAQPEAIEFPTGHGLTAHAFFYPPQNRDYVAPSGERPPLLVRSHGGPTSAATATLNLEIQFWTSRGIAVLDVNYGGSSGYGRAYRERLKGQWGVVDVDDCVNGARHLVERGLVDGRRLAIRGGSAGGYTALAALTFHSLFQAGASRYGVSDLEALAQDTHKFESHYLDGLIGPYPERRDLYLQRSPIHHTGHLSRPIIFFQGLEDRVVPPSQAEKMVQALRARGLPVAYIAFEGEQHGFRRAENIKRALDAELYFYSRIFGFPLAEPVEPIVIENLPAVG